MSVKCETVCRCARRSKHARRLAIVIAFMMGAVRASQRGHGSERSDGAHLLLDGVTDLSDLDGRFINLLSSTGVSVNVRIEEIEFVRLEMREEVVRRRVNMHGSCITEAHVLLGNELVDAPALELSVWADLPQTRAVNVSCYYGRGALLRVRAFGFVVPPEQRSCNGAHVEVKHAEVHVSTGRGWKLHIRTHRVYGWIAGPRHSLDIVVQRETIDPHTWPAGVSRYPQGLVGQSFASQADGSATANGGAIKGVATDYLTTAPLSPHFGFSRYALQSNETRSSREEPLL